MKMVLDIIENYIVCASLSFAAGIAAAWLYFKQSIQRKGIGQVIECALIQKNISQLDSLSATLNRLVAQMKESGDELSEQIRLAQDIEWNLKPSKSTAAERGDLGVEPQEAIQEEQPQPPPVEEDSDELRCV